MVGTSGTAVLRLTLVTASARMRPSLICGAAGGIDENAIGVWPPTTDWIIGPPPWNGTATMSILSTSATSSSTVFTGSDGCTTSTLGVSAISVTGSKSL